MREWRKGPAAQLGGRAAVPSWYDPEENRSTSTMDGANPMRRRRHRIRRALKWLGLGACGAMTLAIAACLIWNNMAAVPAQQARITLTGGTVVLEYVQEVTPMLEWQPPAGSIFYLDRTSTSRAAWEPFFRMPGKVRRDRKEFIYVPLWAPLFFASGATAWAWWRDRYRTGFCPDCGYNLTGNESGRCPECGFSTNSLTG